MKNLYIKGSKFTPEVNLSVENCVFEIKGPSYSDTIYEDVYMQIIDWVVTEIPKADCKIDFVFAVTLINSIAYKNILQMMIKFVEFRKAGKEISVVWYFEGDDEDNEEPAKDLSNIFDIPFCIKSP